MKIITIRLCVLLLGFGLVVSAGATPSWRFSPVADDLPPSQFTDAFMRGQFSIATAVNNRGHVIGYWLDEAGVFHGFNVVRGNNPKYVLWDTPDFLFLAAPEPTCFLFFCSVVVPWGIRIDDGLASSAFLTTYIGSSPLPGSLPFTRFPGNFVDSNAAGVVASTQVGAEGQFGAIVDAQGALVLDDVSWLVAINDLPQPLLLGYVGNADCAVYGGCADPSDSCDEGDGHRNQLGQGHTSHGNGHGYGHDKCRRQSDGSDASANTTVVTSEPTVQDGTIVVRFNSDRSVSRYRIPADANVAGSPASLSSVFPLAMNNDQLVVRADIVVSGVRYHQQLLRCRFDPQYLDSDLDGVLDCNGGLVPVLPLDDSLRVATVLGFSLNHAGTLLGNLGFRSSGVGEPFVIDMQTDVPTLELLASRIQPAGGWELNLVSDVNQAGKVVGFGYQQCGDQPEAFVLEPASLAGSDLGFIPARPELATTVMPGDTLTYLPAVRGGSGAYIYRYLVFDYYSQEWQDVQGWSDQALRWPVPDTGGPVCVRVQVADTANPDDVRERVIRYARGDAPSGDPAQPAASDIGVAAEQTVPAVGAVSCLWLLSAVLLWRRRRHQSR